MLNLRPLLAKITQSQSNTTENHLSATTYKPTLDFIHLCKYKAIYTVSHESHTKPRITSEIYVHVFETWWELRLPTDHLRGRVHTCSRKVGG